MSSSLMVSGDISHLIHLIRGQRVMLDADLARLYGIPTHRFNEAVRRNRDRFPEDFMFQLTPKEHAALKSQFAISKTGRGGRRFSPYAFTEHGALMAANVLNSPQAVTTSVRIVRAFIQLRRMALSVEGLARKLNLLERKVETHDHRFKVVFDSLRQLMTSSDLPRRRIGFGGDD